MWRVFIFSVLSFGFAIPSVFSKSVAEETKPSIFIPRLRIYERISEMPRPRIPEIPVFNLPTKPKCLSSLQKLKSLLHPKTLILRPTKKILKLVLYVHLSGFIITQAFHFNAALRGNDYLGFGVEGNFEDFKSKLTAQELELLKDPEKNEMEIADLVSTKLGSGYEINAEAPRFFAESRSVNSLMKEECTVGGVCRHKAVAVVYILNQMGIPAELGISIQKHSKDLHVFVYLPRTQKAFNAGEGYISDVDEFYKYQVNHAIKGPWISTYMKYFAPFQ